MEKKKSKETRPGQVGRMLIDGGQQSTMVSILACGPSCSGLIPRFPNNFSEEKIADVAEVDQGRGLEESVQRLESVDPTYLETAVGKLVLQK